MLHIVSYDLIKRKDYPELINRLKQYTSLKILLSVWLVRTTATAKDVRDELNRYIDADDRLFVGEMAKNAAWATLLAADATVKAFIEQS
jgi:hypothetical protein